MYVKNRKSELGKVKKEKHVYNEDGKQLHLLRISKIILEFDLSKLKKKKYILAQISHKQKLGSIDIKWDRISWKRWNWTFDNTPSDLTHWSLVICYDYTVAILHAQTKMAPETQGHKPPSQFSMMDFH